MLEERIKYTFIREHEAWCYSPEDGNITITDSKRKVFAKTNCCSERPVICNPHDVRRVYMLGNSSRPRSKWVAGCYAPCRKPTEGVRTVRAAKNGSNASENAGISQTAVVSKSVGFSNPEDSKSHVVNTVDSHLHIGKARPNYIWEEIKVSCHRM